MIIEIGANEFAVLSIIANSFNSYVVIYTDAEGHEQCVILDKNSFRDSVLKPTWFETF